MNHSPRTPLTEVDFYYRTLVCIKVTILNAAITATDANMTVV